ncbi:MAG: hypothetical protein M1814_003806 [Vezdaea aestivalis]|nr:MAG: hypothetical protein M1814_003806 [Vezdaea aestivalis]
MAFAALGGQSSNAFSSMTDLQSGQTQIEKGPDLEQVSTENLGFLSYARDTKIRLLSEQWPASAPPSTNASLLSVASIQGLLAAAGPSELVIAGTREVRQIFGSKAGVHNVVPFSPQIRIALPMRLSHVSFTTDEKYLVVALEAGGLAVYDVQRLIQGDQRLAFEMSTSKEPLRAVVPNPTTEKASLLAIVTSEGNLLIADLDTQKYLDGGNGLVLKSGVSCVTWSTKGKQIVAGFGDGTALQLTHEGIEKAQIPRPPDISEGQYVASLSWLSNDVFLVAYCPAPDRMDGADSWTFILITRQGAKFGYQVAASLIYPAVNDLGRNPPSFFTPRLREFPPSLLDTVLIASTMSADIGLITRSSTALTSDMAADSIVNTYTTTSIADDTRRAQIPSNEDGEETSPIGIALDLSSRDIVQQPIPAEDIEASATALPALLALNTQGYLVGWWFVYTDSIRAKTIYPGLAIASGPTNGGFQQPLPLTEKADSTGPTLRQSGFGDTGSTSSAFGSIKPLRLGGEITGSAFGKPPTFGASNAVGGGGFGSSAGLGQRSSPWGAPTSQPITQSKPSSSTFGQPSFGSTAALGANSVAQSASESASGLGTNTTDQPAFGSTSLLGTNGTTQPAFGSSTGLATRGSAWGANITSTAPLLGSTANTTSGGFGSYANQGGFSSVAKAEGEGGFASFSAGFGAQKTAPFGMPTPSNGGTFGSFGKSAPPTTGFGSSAFNLGSTFKGDVIAEDDAPISSFGSEPFGEGFGQALPQQKTEASIPITKEADMEIEEGTVSQPLPAETPQKIKQEELSLFGSSTPLSAPGVHRDQPAPLEATMKQPSPDPIIKVEPHSDNSSPIGVDKSIPEAPLPPDTTSKTAYGPGDSSASSSGTNKPVAEDAPLPPDYTVKKESISEAEAEDATLPPDSTSKPKDANDTPLPRDFTRSSQMVENAPLSPDSTGSSHPVEDTPLPLNFTAPPLIEETPLPSDVSKVSNTDSEQDLNSIEHTISAREEGQAQAEFVVPKPPSALPDRREGSGRPTSHHEAFDEEGSGEDVAKDFSTELTPESSFADSFVDKSPVGERFIAIRRPGEKPKPKPMGNLLFGEISDGSMHRLPPPGRGFRSPRSPSPVREKGKQSTVMPSTRSYSNPEASVEEQIRKDQLLAAERKAQREAEEQQSLIDEQDAAIKAELAADIIPSRTLRDFIAHQDYVGHIDKPGIPGQIEKVYRDINSMIDTLGLNARSVESFILGQHEDRESRGRSRQDLDDEKDWSLSEIDKLVELENSFLELLESERLEDVEVTSSECHDLDLRIRKVRKQYSESKRLLSTQAAAEFSESYNMHPLSLEQGLLVQDLRRQFSDLQNLLNRSEEALTILRAKITASDKSLKQQGNPTVETVMKTIMKMTAVIEKRSGDVDVLESKMRKLRMSSVSSREGSPSQYFTPRRNFMSARTPNSGTESQVFYTPRSRFSTPTRFGSSAGFRSSVGPSGTPVRKKLSGVLPEDVERYRAKQQARQVVSEKLKEAVVKAGPRVTHMNVES